MNLTTNEVVQTRSTDSDGHYEFTADATLSYRLEVAGPTGHQFTAQDALDPNGDPQDAIDSDVSAAGTYSISPGTSPVTVDAGVKLILGSARVYGRVWEDANADGYQGGPDEPGLLGVQVDLKDPNGATVETAYTDGDGEYEFAGIPAGRYTVEFNVPAGAQFSAGSPTTQVDAYAGQHEAVYAGVYYPGVVSGRAWADTNGNGVQDAGEPAVEGLDVYLREGITGSEVAVTTTDSSGGYSFADVIPGRYSVSFGNGYSHAATLQDQGADDTVDSDVGPNTGQTATFVLNSGGSVANLDAGFANAAPVAANDSATTHAGNPVTVDVTANDADPDGDALTVIAVDYDPAAVRGSVTFDGGAVTYTPDDPTFTGSVSFSYTVADGYGGTGTATVVVAVTNTNPPAVADSGAVTYGDSVTVDVRANDPPDPDGDAVAVVGWTDPAHGTVAYNGDGTFTYTPTDAGFAGYDTFTYTVDDGHGGAATATVTLGVTGLISVGQWSISVASLTAVVINLPGSGRRYRLVAEGTARIANDATGEADAEYIRWAGPSGPQDLSSITPVTDMGLRLTGVGSGGNTWGAYRDDHRYQVELEVPGNELAAWYQDVPGHYGDNSGFITLSIWEVVPPL